jgi:hypothetical protein
MYRDSFFLRLGKRIYLYDLKRKAWFPLEFDYQCYNNPIISMAASKVTDRLYISVFDCYSNSCFYTKVVVFPWGLTDTALSGDSSIDWKIEFDNLDFGSGENEKYIRDVIVEMDNEYNLNPVCVSLFNARGCTLCTRVERIPTGMRREIEKFELGRRLKNATIKVGGSFDATPAGLACYPDARNGVLGIDAITIRFRPRGSVED